MSFKKYLNEKMNNKYNGQDIFDDLTKNNQENVKIYFENIEMDLEKSILRKINQQQIEKLNNSKFENIDPYLTFNEKVIPSCKFLIAINESGEYSLFFKTKNIYKTLENNKKEYTRVIYSDIKEKDLSIFNLLDYKKYRTKSIYFLYESEFFKDKNIKIKKEMRLSKENEEKRIKQIEKLQKEFEKREKQMILDSLDNLDNFINLLNTQDWFYQFSDSKNIYSFWSENFGLINTIINKNKNIKISNEFKKYFWDNIDNKIFDKIKQTNFGDLLINKINLLF